MSSVSEQAAEIEREVGMRRQVYGRKVAAGTMRADTADHYTGLMQDAARTLRFIERHARGLRALCNHLMSLDANGRPVDDPPPPSPEERAALLAHPGVRAAVEAWPDAKITVEATQPPLFDDVAGAFPAGTTGPDEGQEE